jgi:ATP-dependent DNA helicase
MKDLCKAKMEVKSEEETLPNAENGDSSLISRAMAEEEEKLLEARIKEEDEERRKEPQADALLNDSQFTKLDELLTQTQMYSEFLLEKMHDITAVSSHILFYHEFFIVGVICFSYC